MINDKAKAWGRFMWGLNNPGVEPEKSLLLFSGRYFNLDAPAANAFEIEDIAHALSNICRFGGHTREFYSVAQHSVLVADLLPPKLKLHGLLHDASEAFLCDVPRPLKYMLPEYRRMEQIIEQALFRAFGLPDNIPDEVKTADILMLATERRDLMCEQYAFWPILHGIEPVDIHIEPWLPTDAHKKFLSAYEESCEQFWR